ncbi:MAG: hypothetical protein ACREX3_14795 [Gammaproteobacteria bacterium]
MVGSSALVDSSNFTFPGLTENIELNVQTTGRPVAVLQEWFEETVVVLWECGVATCECTTAAVMRARARAAVPHSVGLRRLLQVPKTNPGR